MSVLLYGAYGFTGRLIAEEAVDRGLDPILAGRDGPRVARLGRRLGCRWRTVDLDEPPVEPLRDVELVLNCAGPFVHTAAPVVEACLETGAHYLDITGEIDVFQSLARLDREAESAGVCLLPGVGFDVVPTDCLASRVARATPGADTLRVGIDYAGPVSGGTLRTLLEDIDAGGRVRRDGALVRVPLAWNRRVIDFGDGAKPAVTVPLADVETAFYSTGIGDIEAYVAVPPAAVEAMRVGAALSPVFSAGPVKRSLQWLVTGLDPGPTESQREHNSAYVWAEAVADGETVTERIRTPEPYALTVDAATTAVQRVLADPSAGFETPSVALGDGFVLSLSGVELLE